MSAEILPLTTFHLTGDLTGSGLTGMKGLDLRPALFSAYRDLSKLRYDYPMVLVDGAGETPIFSSLSSLVDGVLRDIAPEGIEGERLRRQAMAWESEIRAAVANGETGKLSKLMGKARKTLLAKIQKADLDGMKESLDQLQKSLTLDGEVIDCDEQTPVRLLSHAWGRMQAEKSAKFEAEVGDLIVKLRDILQADFMQTEEARSADNLKGSVGKGFEKIFDFSAMSDMLNEAAPESIQDGALPKKRRARIAAALTQLENQKFFSLASGVKKRESAARPTNSCSPVAPMRARPSRPGSRKWPPWSRPCPLPSWRSKTIIRKPITTHFSRASAKIPWRLRIWPCSRPISSA